MTRYITQSMFIVISNKTFSKRWQQTYRVFQYSYSDGHDVCVCWREISSSWVTSRTCGQRGSEIIRPNIYSVVTRSRARCLGLGPNLRPGRFLSLLQQLYAPIFKPFEIIPCQKFCRPFWKNKIIVAKKKNHLLKPIVCLIVLHLSSSFWNQNTANATWKEANIVGCYHF